MRPDRLATTDAAPAADRLRELPERGSVVLLDGHGCYGLFVGGRDIEGVPARTFPPDCELQRLTISRRSLTRERIARVVAERTGTPIERVRLDMERDYWMSADEAIQCGIVSRVIEKHAELAS
ncbi:MAG: ClpP family protease [Vicinamibacteraceae bacterium]